ncbi:MAG: hypothetical protein IPL35_14410 [Sphingobacteriales bacterium]|nr:hypothetical protein [Sphingobacteriales bacterium]
MNNYKPLAAERFYHIYNKGINGEDIFKQERNYRFFLSKYALYLSPVVDTFAYCLLKNHFHFLIRVKPQKSLQTFYLTNFANTSTQKNRASEGLHSPDFIVSKQFARLFSSFTQSINKTMGRTGSLVETPFERKEIDSDFYFTRLVYYIHFNPQKHGFVKDFRDYEYSSYSSLLAEKATRLARQEVLDWFGNRKQYVSFHEQYSDANAIENYIIEYS